MNFEDDPRVKILADKYERQLARIHDKEDGDENNVA